MSNLKDVLTTICGVILFLCASGTGLIWQLGVTLPTWVGPVALALAGIAGFIIAYYQGKNADGTTKTPDQLALQKKAEVK